MNVRTEKILADFSPLMLIAVYGSVNDYYLESHNIGSNGEVLEGKPLQQETIQGIVDVFFDENKIRSKISGLYPDNLLSCDFLPGGHYKMVWYRPAELKVLHLADGLKLPSGPAWVPATLYVAEKSKLRVFALQNDSRPDINSDLYQAPYYNINSQGDVCFGSARVKLTDKTYSGLIKYWEDMFWLSIFTHLSGDNPTKTNVNMLWKKLLSDNTIKWEQLDELQPTGKKLKSIFR